MMSQFSDDGRTTSSGVAQASGKEGDDLSLNSAGECNAEGSSTDMDAMLRNDPEAQHALAAAILLDMKETPPKHATKDDVARCSDASQLEGNPPRPNTNSIYNLAERERVRKRARAHVYGVSFTLLEPGIDPKVVAEAKEIVPDAVRVREDDTRESLLQRLSSCHELDDMLVLQKGSTLPRVRLNATVYPQPRRISWSVVVRESHEDADGDRVTTMYTYTFSGTMPENWHARPMPRAIFQLGAHLFHAVRTHLSACCQHSPPTACQLLCYYTVFDADIGRHKDNFSLRDAIRAMEAMRARKLTPQQAFEEVAGESKGTPSGGDENSQLIGSDVLVYTECNEAMNFELSFPDPENPYGDKTTYRLDPCYAYPLENGTVFVFKAIDDLFFFHEAHFNIRVRAVGRQDGYRFAYVFRWLTSERDFFEANHCMKPPRKSNS